MQNKKCLAIVVDTSGSMDNAISASETRLSAALRIVSEALAELPDGLAVELHTLGRTRPLAKYKSVREAQTSLRPDTLANRSSSSAIWATLDSIFKDWPAGQAGLVLCITDGEDYGSGVSLAGVQQRRERETPQVQLTVIDITGDLTASAGTAGADTVVEASGGISALTAAVQDRLGVLTEKTTGLRISVSVQPLCAVEPGTVEVIAKAMGDVVPYLERITRLRYYPVPTVLVNREQMAYIRPPKSEHNTSVPAVDFRVLEELLGVLGCISLYVHSHHLEQPPDAVGKPWATPEIYDELRIYFEVLSFDIQGWVLGQTDFNYLENVAERLLSKGLFPKIEANLEGLEVISLLLAEMLALIASQEPWEKCTREDSGGMSFEALPEKEHFTFFMYKSKGEKWGKWRHSDPAIWRRIGTPTQRQALEKCIEEDGQWSRRLPHVATILKICIELLFPMLRAARLSLPGGARTISILRTSGLYIPVGSASQTRLAEVAIQAGCPSAAQFEHHSGVVVIDAASLSTTYSESKELDMHWLYGLLLTHEHAHAIFEEGVDKAQPVGGLSRHQQASKVNESLAEWAELNFGRESEKAFEAVVSHASGGSFPDWPYAGALGVERLMQRQGEKAFHKLVKGLRTDPDKVYRSILRATRA